MIKYFDLGCAEGETVESFLAGKSILPELAKDCTSVIAFDAQAHDAEWRAIEARHPQVNFEFYGFAVGVPHGKMVELAHADHPHKRTVLTSNTNFNGSISRAVGFDFPKYLLATSQPGDVNILKLDIEGSEYDLLDTMIHSGAIKFVDHLFCEFHGRILPAEYAAREAGIRTRCPIPIGGWG